MRDPPSKGGLVASLTLALLLPFLSTSCANQGPRAEVLPGDKQSIQFLMTLGDGTVRGIMDHVHCAPCISEEYLESVVSEFPEGTMATSENLAYVTGKLQDHYDAYNNSAQ